MHNHSRFLWHLEGCLSLFCDVDFCENERNSTHIMTSKTRNESTSAAPMDRIWTALSPRPNTEISAKTWNTILVKNKERKMEFVGVCEYLGRLFYHFCPVSMAVPLFQAESDLWIQAVSRDQRWADRRWTGRGTLALCRLLLSGPCILWWSGLSAGRLDL